MWLVSARRSIPHQRSSVKYSHHRTWPNCPASSPIASRLRDGHSARHCCVGGSGISCDDRGMKCRRPIAPSGQLSSAFAGFRFPPEVIVLAVRWYLRFGLSYRDLEELLAERGVEVDHVTLHRWVLRFTPLLIDAGLAFSIAA